MLFYSYIHYDTLFFSKRGGKGPDNLGSRPSAPRLLSGLKAYRFRILSGLLFFIFLISTWFVFYQKPKYPESLHLSLQEQLKQIIQSTLLKQQPLAQNLQFQKMWTEADRQKDQINAFFRYSFDSEDGAKLFVKGQAIMTRNKVDDIQDLWRVVDIQTNGDKIEFAKPIVLLSDSTGNPIEEKPEITEPQGNGEDESAHNR